MIVFDVVEDVLMLQKSFVDGASNLSNERLDVFFSLILICTERGLCLCMLYVSELMRNGEYFLFQWTKNITYFIFFYFNLEYWIYLMRQVFLHFFDL